MEQFELWIRFPNKEMTAREYIVFSKNILLKLQSFNDDFKNFYAWGSEADAGRYLKEDLSDFEAVVFNQLNDPEIVYINPDKSNKKFTLDSKSFIAYGNAYSTTQNYKEDQITVSIAAGGSDNKDVGILNFEFSESLQSKLDFSYFSQLLQFCIELVDPYYATVISLDLLWKVKSKEQTCRIGWITYIANKDVFHLLPSTLSKKQLEDDGSLFWLSEEKPLSTDELIVKKAIEVRDILIQNGFLNGLSLSNTKTN